WARRGLAPVRAPVVRGGLSPGPATLGPPQARPLWHVCVPRRHLASLYRVRRTGDAFRARGAMEPLPRTIRAVASARGVLWLWLIVGVLVPLVASIAFSSIRWGYALRRP